MMFVGPGWMNKMGKGHLPHESGAVQLPHVRAAHGDAAAVHIPEPGNQAGSGGLAPTTLSQR